MDHSRRPDGTTSPDGTATPSDTRVAGQPKPPSEPRRHAAPPQQAASPRPGAAPGQDTASQPGTAPRQGAASRPGAVPGQDTASQRDTAPQPVAVPRQGAAPGQAGERPEAQGHGPAADSARRGLPERLLDPSDSERFRQRWREVQSGFVDDPAEAVRRADELAGEVTDALGRAVAAHRRALSEAPAPGRDERPDTERLRLALRGYRDLLDRVFDA
ncbi:hypothetical protein [Spirillospora albida]|uniref:hypothetical protein n=1 Tax=Spirillospora albida TaxID=58123 RepID=UPI00068B0846|nr:hypothetical protein [Spirillospora albida]